MDTEARLAAMERILRQLVRHGIVTDVDRENNMARVKFQGDEMTSGWLYILQHPGAGLQITPDGGHGHTTEIAGGHNHPGSAEHIAEDGLHTHVIIPVEDHTHPGSCVTSWTPNINDKVLVLYLPILNSDGFVLGRFG